MKRQETIRGSSRVSPDERPHAYKQRLAVDATRLRSRGLLLRRIEKCVRECFDQLEQRESVLDFGCGSRPYREMMLEYFDRYIGADLDGNELADVTMGRDLLVPLESASVDCVVSTQVLEHVVNPASYLREAWRVIRPNGALILSTHGHWKYHPDPLDLWRWTGEGLRLQLKNAGFDVINVRGIFGLAATAVQFWQDATISLCPRLLSAIYVSLLQFFIRVIDPAELGRDRNDAAVLVVLAKKSTGGNLVLGS